MEPVKHNLPPEVEKLIERIPVLRNGTKYHELLVDFDYMSVTLKVAYLASTAEYKEGIIHFLKKAFLPAVIWACDMEDQLVAGANLIPIFTNDPRKPYQKLEFPFRSDMEVEKMDIKGFEKISREHHDYAKERFFEELDFYLEHLKPLIEEGNDKDDDVNSVVRENETKIKTNLSVDELAMLFKILIEFDSTDAKAKTLLKKHESKRALYRAVIAAFSTAGAESPGLRSFESKYGSTDQIEAVDFWIKKFMSLSASARALRGTLLEKDDKASSKPKSKLKKSK